MQLAFWHPLRRISAIWIVIGCLALAAAAHGRVNLSFSHVLPAEVEALGQINSLIMDPAGFMWFAGVSGLGRYDGYELKIFHHHPRDPSSLASSAVNGLLVDSGGQLWAATEASLARFDPSIERFTNYYPAGAGSGAVRRLVEGAPGELWLVGGGGLLRFDVVSGQFTAIDLQTPAGLDPGIWDIARDSRGRLWLATRAQGLMRYDPADGALRRWPTADSRGALRAADLRAVHVDASDRVWVGSFSGHLQSLQPDGTLRDYELPPGARREAVWSITSDTTGALWVGDGVGINHLAPGSRLLERWVYSESEPSGPGNHVPLSVYSDPRGQLWFGYFPSGVDRLERDAASFQNHRHLAHDPNSITDGGVLAGLEDARGNLWVGTGFGLNYVDRRHRRVTRYTALAGDDGSLSGNAALSLHLDRAGQLWVGVWSRGLNRLDPASGRVLRQYHSEAGNPRSLLGLEPWRILGDSQGRIWVATELGLNRYEPESDDFTRFLPAPALFGGETQFHGRDLLELAPGRLLVASNRGLLMLDTASGHYRRYRHDPADPSSLSSDAVNSLLRDSRDRLWVGTHGGGLNLFDLASGSFSTYHLRHGLPNPVINSMVEDTAGRLWLATLHGISRFDPATESFTNYNQSHGLLDNVHHRNSAFRTRAGELFVGNSKGYSLVDTTALKPNPTPPPVVLTDLQVFNQRQIPGAEGSVLRLALDQTEAITLRHDQTVFSLTFAALNYRLPEQNRYAYRLEGFDQDWQQSGGQRTATYTNLDPGRYTFRVRAANNDGVWNEQGRSLAITVLAPPWATGWAYAAYALLGLGLAWLGWQGVYKHLQLKQQQALTARLQRLDRIKDTFLANTSHELRTPLNGIIGIADAMLHGATGPLGNDAMHKLALISQSGKRLAELVDDILDYAKLTEAKLKIQLVPVNLGQLTGEAVQLLQQLASQKGLALINRVPEAGLWALGDANRLRQVLLNLMGNAIQYTDRGSVTLSLTERDRWLEICVADTGAGIPESDREQIFSAYCQLGEAGDLPRGGAGLGLAISKELVELHGGQISVESNGGRGTVFRFTLQQAAPGAAVPAPRRQASASRETELEGHSEAPRVHQPLVDSPERYTVLVADDDPVNRMVLGGLLRLHGYGVVEAESGQDALDLVHSGAAVDLVILDVMMPFLNGFEVCRRLRLMFDRRQLPILLLTAKKTDSDLERGYEAGANAFLGKPVSRYELLPQVANLLELRQRPAAVRSARG